MTKNWNTGFQLNSWNISVTCTRFFLSSLNVWRGHVDIWFENILEKIKNLPFLLSSLPILPSRTNRQGYSGVFYLKTEFQNFTGCSGKIRAVQDIFHFWIGKVYVGTLLWAQKRNRLSYLTRWNKILRKYRKYYK